MNLKFISLIINLIKCNEKIIVAYYQDNAGDILPPEKIQYEKVTHINYSFGVINKEQKLEISNKDLLKRLSKHSQLNNVQLILSVGGWGGSKHFSSMVSTEQNRKNFINQTKEIMKEYEFKGIDLDWEYPGRLGLDCNEVDYEKDTPNLIQLIKEMRQEFESESLITLAVPTMPFYVNNKTSTDLKEFGNLVDFINIMAYDLGTNKDKLSGPNAPVNHQKGKGNQRSIIQSIRSWNKVGVSRNKIVIGLPFYGKSTKLKSKLKKELGIFQPIEDDLPKGDSSDSLSPGLCPSDKETLSYSGVWTWKELRKDILITHNQTSNEWTRYWDSKSQTPYLYNEEKLIHITYDDPQSLSNKANIVKSLGLKGLMFWSLDLDNGELLDSIQLVREQFY